MYILFIILLSFTGNQLIKLSVFGFPKKNNLLEIREEDFYFSNFNTLGVRPNLYINGFPNTYINKIPGFTIFFKYYHSEYGAIYRFSKEGKYIDKIYSNLLENEETR